MNSKRYLLFAGDDYYPIGGWEDHIQSFETLEAAEQATNIAWDWWHIVDLQTQDIVKRS